MENNDIRRILLIKRGALGDVLLTTPLIHALRLRYPDAKIDYMTGSWSAPALSSNPDLRSIITFWDYHNSILLFFSMLPSFIRAWNTGYDIVFALDKAWQAGLLTRILGRRSVGFNRDGEGFMLSDAVLYGQEPSKDVTHDIISYLMLGKKVGCISSDTRMIFSIMREDIVRAKKLLEHIPKPFIAICPGGARNPYQEMAARRWPRERYAALASEVVKKGIGVVILGSRSDGGEASYVVNSCNNPLVVSLVGKTTFSQTGAVLSLSKAAVSHDTALMHLGSAMNVPVIALFGPTDPSLKKPLSVGSVTIWDESPCANCRQRICHVENVPVDPRCAVRMERITVSQVLSHLLPLLIT